MSKTYNHPSTTIRAIQDRNCWTDDTLLGVLLDAIDGLEPTIIMATDEKIDPRATLLAAIELRVEGSDPDNDVDCPDYEFAARIDDEIVILRELDTGKLEVFAARPDGYSGFTVVVGGIDHEFCRSATDGDKKAAGL